LDTNISGISSQPFLIVDENWWNEVVTHGYPWKQHHLFGAVVLQPNRWCLVVGKGNHFIYYEYPINNQWMSVISH
jgi:hypothetical protein